MKQILRIFSAFLLILCVCLFAACDESENTSDPSSPSSPSADSSGSDPSTAHTHTLTHHEAKNADCFTAGNAEYWECTDCDKCFSDAEGSTEIIDKSTVILAATAHRDSFTHHSATESSCTTEGNREYWSCSACQKIFADAGAAIEINDKSSVILPAAHPSIWAHTATQHSVTYSCEHTGTEPDAAAHQMENGVCTACGIFAGTPGLDYTINATQTAYTLTGRGTASGTDIVIATYHEGLPVTAIASYVFSGNSTITSLIIPQCITSIGTNAFKNCTALTAVGFYATNCSNLTSSAQPFYGAARVTDGEGFALTVGANVTRIPEYFCYAPSNSGPKIKSLIFEQGSVCTSIGKAAFFWSNYMSTLILPQGLQSIGVEAFVCCAVTSLSLPASLTSLGTDAFYRCSKLTNLYYNAAALEISGCPFEGLGSKNAGCHVVIGKNVTKIPKRLFNNISADYKLYLASLTFEAGSVCATIAQEAFAGCDGIVELAIPVSVTTIGSNAFVSCTTLRSLTFDPASTVSLADHAFTNAYSLTELVLPTEMTFNTRAFISCHRLVRITYYGSSTFYEEDIPGREILTDANATFANTLTRHDDGTVTLTVGNTVYLLDYTGAGEVLDLSGKGISKIKPYALLHCKQLTALTVPAEVNEIGQYAFQSCINLTSVNYNAINAADTTSPFKNAGTAADGITVTVGAAVTRIPANLFYSSTSSDEAANIKAVSFASGSNLQSIGKQAFYYCRSLQNINMPAALISIEENAFYECGATLRIHIESFSAWCAINFANDKANPLYYSAALVDANNGALTTVTIPTGVTEIKSYAFCHARSLATVSIPATVTQIGAYAFWGCDALQTLNIPTDSTLTTIGSHAFYATQINTLTLPNSVERIEDHAFAAIPELTTANLGTALSYIGQSAFNGCGLTSIRLPSTLSSIGSTAFYNCNALLSAVIEGDNAAWEISQSASFSSAVYSIEESAFSDEASTASLLRSGYASYYWRRTVSS